MISRKHRFHGSKSLNAVYRKGKAARGEFVSLKYLQTNRQDYRMAVVVSRKVSKSAVVRNRIRRRIYEIVRLYRKDAKQPIPYDLVVSVFDERVATMPPEILTKKIAALLESVD